MSSFLKYFGGCLRDISGLLQGHPRSLHNKTVTVDQRLNTVQLRVPLQKIKNKKALGVKKKQIHNSMRRFALLSFCCQLYNYFKW
jgi:hypothetical protein